MTTALSVFVIYFDTSDYPGMYIVREARCEEPLGDRQWPPNGFYLDDELSPVATALWPTAVVSSLEEARLIIQRKRPGLVKMMPSPNDDPVIVETWL